MKQCRGTCCLSCQGCNLTVLHAVDTLSAWFLRTGVRSRVVRRTFMGLVWLAVRVVARLSSRVLQLRRQVNAVCGRRQRANTARLLWLRLWPARQQTSMQVILKHWHKKNETTLALVNVLHVLSIHHSLTCATLELRIVFFCETVQLIFVRHEARTGLCCCMMPAKVLDGRLVNVERAHKDSATANRNVAGYHSSSTTTHRMRLAPFRCTGQSSKQFCRKCLFHLRHRICSVL